MSSCLVVVLLLVLCLKKYFICIFVMMVPLSCLCIVHIISYKLACACLADLTKICNFQWCVRATLPWLAMAPCVTPTSYTPSPCYPRQVSSTRQVRPRFRIGILHNIMHILFNVLLMCSCSKPLLSLPT